MAVLSVDHPPDDPAGGVDAPLSGILGDYRIVRQIGRGGMGIVYEAEQISIGRRVALKVLPFAAMLDQRQIQRFKHEVQAAGQLHHTNIVPVFNVGCERGVHYYAMQFIDGQTLAEVITDWRRIRRDGIGIDLQFASPVAAERSREVNRSIDVTNTAVFSERQGSDDLWRGASVRIGNSVDRAAASAVSTEHTTNSAEFWRTVARLGIQAAQGLEHAHQHAIVHRDVKPSNLLLDRHGNLWITDFGLARIESDAGLTITGDLVGTLRYMSPEQVSGHTMIDHRSDIYALGATLYELLTLQSAFGSNDRRLLLKQISNDEVKPPRRINPAIPEELETIVLKAMAKSPVERYASAQELADDLNRFLQDMPIRARRATITQHCLKWMRRHRHAVTAFVAALILALSAGVVGLVVSHRMVEVERDRAWWHEEQANRQRDLAERLAGESQRRQVQLTVAHGVRLLDDGDPLGALPWFAESLRRDTPEHSDVHRFRIDWLLAATPRPSRMWFHNQPVNHAEFSPDGELMAIASDDGNAYVWHVASGEAATPPLLCGSSVWSLTFTRDSKRLVTLSHDRRIRVWDVVPSGSPMPRIVLESKGWPICAAVSSDGRFLVAGGEMSGAGFAEVWNMETGVLLHGPFMHLGTVTHVEFSPDASRIVTASNDYSARLWETNSGNLIATLQHGDVVRVARFSPNGRLIATASSDTSAAVWDAATGQRRHRLQHDDQVHDVRFNLDGTLLATAGVDRTARIWDTASGAPVYDPLRHSASVRFALFGVDGQSLITGCGDGRLYVWDVTSAAQVVPAMIHSAQIKSLARNRDGRHILSVGIDGSVRLWDLSTTMAETQILQHHHIVYQAAFSADGSRVVSASYDGTARVWDAETGRPVTNPLRHSSHVYRACFSHDDRYVLTACADFAARVWDARTGELRWTLRHDGTPQRPPLTKMDGVVWAVFSDDDNRIATAGMDNSARIWNASDGSMIASLPHSHAVNHVCFSGDGMHVMTSSFRSAKIWRIVAPRQIELVCDIPHPNAVLRAQFSPDGQRVATVSVNEVRFWDVSNGKAVGPVLVHDAPILRVDYSVRGDRIVTCSQDHTAQIWDAESGQQLAPPLGHGAMVTSASFSRDGRFVLTSSRDNTARVWDAETGDPLTTGLRHWARIEHAEFSRDGRRVLTASNDNTVRIWDLRRSERSNSRARLLVELLTKRVSQSGAAVVMEPTAQRVAWESLRAAEPEFFEASAQQVARWHAHEAERASWDSERLQQRAEQDHRPPANAELQRNVLAASAAHWDAAIKGEPDRWSSFYQRARVLMILGRWSEAASDLRQSVQLGADGSQVARHLNNLAWSMVSHDRATPLITYQAVELASIAVEIAPVEPAYWNTLGVAQHRCEQWGEAIKSLAKSAELLQGDQYSFNGFFLSMAHYQLGNVAAAREHYDRAVEWMEENRPEDRELLRFKSEADRMMGGSKSNADDP